MSLSNPQSSARDSARAYVKSLLAVLGDQEPLDVMASTSDSLRLIFKSVDDAALRQPERPGKWSMLQVAGHLADGELVVATRIRFVVAEDDPALPGYDQDRWVAELWNGEVGIEEVLEQFSATRKANLRLLRGLTPAQWERAGIHSERGLETVRHISKLSAAHDLVHLRQLARIRAAVH